MGSAHHYYKFQHQLPHPHLLLLLLLLSLVAARAGARSHNSVAAAAAPSAAAAEFLDGQNAARAAVGVAPLRWSPALAADAAAAAKRQRPRCEFAELGKSPYGANQAWTSYPARPAEVVASWVATGKHYDRATDTCSGGGGGDDCGTYKQVVWRRTLELGCAQATCGGGATLTLCLYYPHGNVRGQPPY
uniref:SCP domain-containing protein n=1 Tax=Ananas comosus var. bracteatus TaxID=296719 RepID=A0A6V7QY05_ANACO